ncbi:hypothetical protein GCM10010399_90250 [Dactylosporangium fulvum]
MAGREAVGVGPQRVEQLVQGRVADARLELDAGDPQHPHPGVPGLRGGRVEQSRLADPGLAAQQQAAASPLGANLDQKLVEEFQFAGAPHQASRNGTGHSDVLRSAAFNRFGSRLGIRPVSGKRSPRIRVANRFPGPAVGNPVTDATPRRTANAVK